MSTRYVACLVSFTLVVLVACAAEPTSAPPATAVPQALDEISQLVTDWGEVADQLWVLVGYGDGANPTVVEEGTKITAVFSSVETTAASPSKAPSAPP